MGVGGNCFGQFSDMEKILGFIDLLGFSKMVSKDHDKATDILDDFYNICFRIIKENQQVEGNLFSDSLMAYSTDNAALINCLTEIYRQCLRKNGEYENTENFFLLPRGAVSIGFVNIEERHTSPNLKKDFIVSPALVHSAGLEKMIKGSRLLIAVKSEKEDLGITWNQDIKSILFENSSFEFWKYYQYMDTLWFLDLTKDYNTQKAEVIQLIKIAAKLTKENSNEASVLDQHTNTLRIGLLSYTKFLGRENDEIINLIISDFQDDKYWLIWMTLIEMIMNSTYEWKYAAMRSVITFYQKTSLTEGWIHVLKEINNPKNSYIKASFTKFLDEMSIQTID
jgi:hypothetical protein